MNTPSKTTFFSEKNIFLSQMTIGQQGTIDKLLGEGEITQRLLEMGLTPGAEIQVVRFAPLGDPIDIKIRGYHLSLRRQEAEVIQVVLKDSY